MTPPAIVLTAVLLAGCATGQQPGSSAASGPAPRSQAEDDGSQPPAFLSRPPWSMKKDLGGNFIHFQAEARMQFPASAGGLDRQSVRIYDEGTNDVGVSYAGALPVSKPECLYGLSVFVYPATEPLARHLEAVRAEFLKANPGAVPADRVLSLDASHGDTGVHAAYLNDINSLESFEGISLYVRGRWFIKYRTTFGPARRAGCQQRIREAVSAMQLPGQ
jgi:hypothetical protein